MSHPKTKHTQHTLITTRGNARRAPLVPKLRNLLEALEDRLNPVASISANNLSFALSAGSTGITVTRSGDLGPQVTVGYSFTDGTAVNGTNYTGTSGSITFPSGSTSQNIPVTILTNTFAGQTAQFTVNLTGIISVSGTPAASPQFNMSSNIGALNGPESIRIGDINGDGKPDLVIANYVGNTISVLLNTTTKPKHTQHIAAIQNFSVGGGTDSVALADLNADGKLDIVCAVRSSNKVVVLMNTTTTGSSTATFSGPTLFSVGSSPRGVAVADVNCVGCVWFVLWYYSSNTVSVLLNNTATGAGTPVLAAQQTFAAGTGPRSVVTADFNGDGKQDIAVSNYIQSGTGAVTVLLNGTANGSSTASFTTQAALALPSGSHGFNLATGDINGDGKSDIAVADAGGSVNTVVSVFLDTTTTGASTTSFSAATNLTILNDAHGITLADVNGDGKPDLVVADDSGNSVSVLFNTTTTGASTPSFTATQNYTVGGNPYSVAVADLNGDGFPDIAVPGFNGQNVEVLLNTQAVITGATGTETIWKPPTVSGISPNAGPAAGGTSVVITGTNFTGATAVKFGAIAATSFTVNSATQITATAPAGSAGTVDIVVTTPGGPSATSAADQFTYNPVPAVTSISPTSGPVVGGTSVTITGTGFLGATGVKFGTTNATSFTVNSATSITATSPGLAAGAYDITVTTPGGTSALTAADKFTYIVGPAVTSISTAVGPTSGGTSVVVTGTNFTGATAVKFGATNATSFTVNSATSITATSPAGSAGTVDITVITPGGTSATSAADQFTYFALPAVTAIAPTAGPLAGGTSVTITGTSFTGTTSVKFGTTNATSFTVNSATSITATSPALASGSYDITVTTPGGTSALSAADRFSYLAAPTVTAIAPALGPTIGGTSVTITGTNFTSATAVKFGTTNTTSFTVNSATSITATAPALATGTYDITVTTPGGTSATSAADRFTYSPLPAVTAIAPSQGPAAGGTSITITGTTFTGATAVKFGTTNATSFTVNSATSITATAPALAAGTYDITVTTAVGSSATSAADQFTYFALPTVTAIAPTAGPTAGGTSVTITGTNFSGATAVKFGGTNATSFTVNSTTSITATSPAGAGTLDITVTSPGGTSATSAADRFTFTPAPTVTVIAPTQGTTLGGTSITITGTNFTGATAVKFGGVNATSFTVNSATSITAGAPAAAAGVVDVTVVTAGGTSAISAADKFTYIQAPVVSSLSTSGGPLAGGTSVVITGNGFTGATAVKFGATNATSFTVNSATQITATAPAGSAGTVDIIVTTAVGTSATSASDKFTYFAQPTVTAIAPSAGPTAGGASVSITGTNFTGVTAVLFGGTNATTFTVNSATSITATSPAGAGTVDVTVVSPGGTSAISAADKYTFTAAPTVSGIAPNQGPSSGAASVVITGTNFTGTTAVRFGATNATTFTVNSATQITATAPAGSGTVDITVITAGGTSATSVADQFSYFALPTVTTISPNSGPLGGGTAVTITGTNFTGTTAVKFGATNATTFTVNSATQITATAPAGSGTVDITVTSPGGTSTTSAADRYTFTSAPSVSGISPNQGPTGGSTSVTITGANFTGATAVKFGTTNATSFTVNSATQITATAPAGSGTVDITVTSPGGTSATSSADQFSYFALPSVTGISPATGPLVGGTSVIITGTAFTGATAVKFGTTNATSFTVNSATQITATAPAGSGIVDITITTPGGTSTITAADKFTYTAAPTVTGISPNSGPLAGGTSVTITGSGFTGATAVKFGTTNAVSFTVNSATQITATAPAGSGTLDVTVTTVGGTSSTSAADRFTYSTIPAVAGISPNSGPLAGGTSVTITGTNFIGATSVKFGTTNATSFTVNSATQITATAPAGSGTLDVTVTTPGGTSSTLPADQFFYIAAPNVTGVSPNAGPVAGGTSVTITGTGFSGATSLLFGSAGATFTVNSATSITATAPAGSGTVGVSVVTIGGTGTAAAAFTYVSAPTISNVSPNAGPTAGGTTITITGTNFAAGTTVTIGGIAAVNVTVTSSTRLTAATPVGSLGSVTLVVTTPGGTASSSFTYDPVPVVTGISPNIGNLAGGTTIIITGSGFAAATSVTIGGIAATSFTVTSPTTISAVVPSGLSGTADVVVLSPGGSSPTSSADQFTAAAAPVVSGVSLTSGTGAGATVAIIGSGFLNVTSVDFGGVPAANFTVNSDTSITAVAPSGVVGSVDIVVSAAGGASTPNANDQFSFAPALPSPLLIGDTQYAVGADAGGAPTVNYYSQSGGLLWSMQPFGSSITGGLRVATRDFNGDGVADVAVGTVVCPGCGVIDGKTQQVLFKIDPFEAAFTGGVFVTVGDLTGSGRPELVITPDQGGGPRVRVFDGGNNFAQLADFFGIDDPNFRGGARSAIGDFTGKGYGDLIVAAGFGGGPRIAAFDGQSLSTGTPKKIFADFFAFESTLSNGTFVTVGDINGDGHADLIAGGGPGGGPRVSVFDGAGLMNNQQNRIIDFFAGDVNNRGGVRIAVKNLDNDKFADLIVGDGANAGSTVTTYTGVELLANPGNPTANSTFDALPGFNGGVYVG